MNYEALLNKRIVLTCKNNLSYSGILKNIIALPEDKEYVMVELDEKSGFAILSPKDFIERVLEIPIRENQS
jgi:hypothetical protein